MIQKNYVCVKNTLKQKLVHIIEITTRGLTLCADWVTYPMICA